MEAKKAKTEHTAVSNFREYLRCKTVQPEPDYDDAVALLKRLATEIGLEYECVTVATGDPVVILKWPGKKPELKSLLLNSHMDVVPVFMKHWDWDPFAAEKTENGNIYARGTQDMKCVGIQYLEAIRRLKETGFQPLRNVFLTYVPDEEVGGSGMRHFLLHESSKKINIGFGLDEGLANPGDKYTVFYGERGTSHLTVTCPGNTGHGSRFVENTAAEKFQKIVNSGLAFREKHKERMLKENVKLGDVPSLNLTIVEGGLQYNVLPTELKVHFDIRLSESFTKEDLIKEVEGWCADAGEGVSYEFSFLFESSITQVGKNLPWWVAFEDVMTKKSIDFDLEIFPAATDSRYLRAAGYPCIGFSPMKNTPILLHDHNEFLNEDVFMEGIGAYESIIPALSDVPEIPKWEEI